MFLLLFVPCLIDFSRGGADGAFAEDFKCIQGLLIVMKHYENQWAIDKWNDLDFSRIKGRSHNSLYFTIRGFNYLLMVHLRGNIVALLGHNSVYLQVMDPRSTKFDCFVSYTLKFLNHMEDTMFVCRES